MFKAHNSFKATLGCVSNVLNDNEIVWCLGASGSLYVQGVAVTPKDLDIIVEISQFDEVYSLLKEFQPSERKERIFAGDKYYRVELKEVKFPAEIVGFDLDKSTIAAYEWEGLQTFIHPLDMELRMYKKRPDKEHVVELIEDILKKA